jgi:cytochrome c-type biogenesis protein
MGLPFTLAFTAGLVATVNPCGFAMLPAYLSYFMGLDDDRDTPVALGVWRGLRVGAVVSAGFLTVFGLAGALLTLGLQTLVSVVPWAAMLVGVGVAGLGVAMLFGYHLQTSLPKMGKAGEGPSLGGVIVFGVSYAIASLSCTLPVFLVVVAGAIPQLGFVRGVATFVVYGLGMSTLLLVVTLALAFGKHALIGRLRRSSRLVDRISGSILVVAGGYIVLFWVTTLAGGGTTQAAPVVWVERLSSAATNAVAGASVHLGLAATALLLATAIWALGSRHRHHAGSPGRPREPAAEPSDQSH